MVTVMTVAVAVAGVVAVVAAVATVATATATVASVIGSVHDARVMVRARASESHKAGMRVGSIGPSASTSRVQLPPPAMRNDAAQPSREIAKAARQSYDATSV